MYVSLLKVYSLVALPPGTRCGPISIDSFLGCWVCTASVYVSTINRQMEVSGGETTTKHMEPDFNHLNVEKSFCHLLNLQLQFSHENVSACLLFILGLPSGGPNYCERRTDAVHTVRRKKVRKRETESVKSPARLTCSTSRRQKKTSHGLKCWTPVRRWEPIRRTQWMKGRIRLINQVSLQHCIVNFFSFLDLFFSPLNKSLEIPTSRLTGSAEDQTRLCRCECLRTAC